MCSSTGRTPAGTKSSEIHRRYIQKVQTRTAARVFRARDGKVVSGALLFEPGRNGWSGLKDVDFRVGNYGRLDFTIDGEDYHSQYMPVGMQQIVAPPELMLAQMQYAGVDHCRAAGGRGYGAMNDYNAFAQSQYPGKFTGLLNVDEPRAYTEAALREFDRAVGAAAFGACISRSIRLRAMISTSRSTIRAWMRSGRGSMRPGCRCSSRCRHPDYDAPARSPTCSAARADGPLSQRPLGAGDGPPVGFFGRPAHGNFRRGAGRLPPRNC